MPRPQRPWFRFYVEAVHDRKLRRLPPAQRWVWVVVLAAARESVRPGVLLMAEGQALDEYDLADKAAVPRQEVCRALEAFTAVGMLDRTADGAYRVCKWEERQFESDDVTTRTRRHRSREPNGNVPTSFPGTPPESETDTESYPSSSEEPRADPPPDDDRPNRRVETALAILADRDLDRRQTNPSLEPISDSEAWTRKALARRRGTDGPHLAAIAAVHPRLTPTELADRVDTQTAAADRSGHRLDDQQAAQRASAERHMTEVAERRGVPIDPVANVANLHDIRASLRPRETS